MCRRLLTPVRIRSILYIDPGIFISKELTIVLPVSVFQVSACHPFIHKLTDTIVNTGKIVCALSGWCINCIQAEQVILIFCNTARSPATLIDRDPQRQQRIHAVLILVCHEWIACSRQFWHRRIFPCVWHRGIQNAVQFIRRICGALIHIQKLEIIIERIAGIDSRRTVRTIPVICGHYIVIVIEIMSIVAVILNALAQIGWRRSVIDRWSRTLLQILGYVVVQLTAWHFVITYIVCNAAVSDQLY